jgi:hypothetical protein
MPGASSTRGHMIDLGAGHAIAIYERDGVSRVAEFREGRGETMPAGAWFRFHGALLRHWHDEGAGVRCSGPLTAQMVEAIERLHVEREERRRGLLTVLGTVAAAARRWWTGATSGSAIGRSVRATVPVEPSSRYHPGRATRKDRPCDSEPSDRC